MVTVVGFMRTLPLQLRLEAGRVYCGVTQTLRTQLIPFYNEDFDIYHARCLTCGKPVEIKCLLCAKRDLMTN